MPSLSVSPLNPCDASQVLQPAGTLSRWVAKSIALGMVGLSAQAQSATASEDLASLAPVMVTESRNTQLGVAETGSSGAVTQKKLEAKAVFRAAELLEVTPGLIATQHSGEGKANQFYLRGFNLDHGTDLRTTIDGMLVNQRSHAHGQGWSDLNFLIPELATQLDYRKGPFFASDGDFSAAGAVSIRYADKLDSGVAVLGVGQNGYRRTLVANSPQLGDGRLLYALELQHADGPFDRPDNFGKINGVLRYSQGTQANGFNLTAMAYSAKWNATDQIPLRAVTSGQLGRFAAVDNTDGGQAARYSLSGAWRNTTAQGALMVQAYVVRQQLDLYSNFTYFNNDPVNGDQFNQADRRVSTGLKANHLRQHKWFDKESLTTVGVQIENDNINNGLHSTAARQRLSTTRQDHVVQSSLGLYAENTTYWNSWFRTTAGLREDVYFFDVKSNNPANSGNSKSSISSPKLGVVFGPWSSTEFYVNAGTGFHSNDARGTAITVDPRSGDPVKKVAPLVRAKGLELSVRTEFLPGLKSALSFYRLDFDSELIFVGDAGTTSPGRASRRTGFEFSNYYQWLSWLTVDADVAVTKARFREFDPVGDRIPGAIEGVASVALAVDRGPYFGALQLRYFGPRPLTEDNSIRSQSTITLNGRMGYRFNKNTRVSLEVFNLTQRKDSAIDYYYTSRLPGESVGVKDIHFHPMEPRSLRLNITRNF